MTDLRRGVEILHGSRAIWVNGDGGVCLGRFGVMGIDIHRDSASQLAGEPECLDCTHRRSTLADWARFRDGMLAHHGVQIAAEPVPQWLAASPSQEPR